MSTTEENESVSALSRHLQLDKVNPEIPKLRMLQTPNREGGGGGEESLTTSISTMTFRVLQIQLGLDWDTSDITLKWSEVYSMQWTAFHLLYREVDIKAIWNHQSFPWCPIRSMLPTFITYVARCLWHYIHMQSCTVPLEYKADNWIKPRMEGTVVMSNLTIQVCLRCSRLSLFYRSVAEKRHENMAQLPRNRFVIVTA